MDDSNVRILGRDEILQAQDSRTEKVPVPEWHGTVLVKSLTGTERDQYEATILQQNKNGRISVRMNNARAKLVAKCCVDEDGSLLFSDEDIFVLGAKSAKALSRVYDKAAELSGLRDEDIEELVGNSEADQNEGSISS